MIVSLLLEIFQITRVKTFPTCFIKILQLPRAKKLINLTRNHGVYLLINVHVQYIK